GTRNKEKEKQVFDSELQYIVDCFKDYDTILLSDESIWWATATRRKGLWKDLKKHSEQHNYQIKVIVYLRRQDQFMMSRYNQKLKTDFVASTQSFDEYFAQMNGKYKCVMDYRDRIDNIAKSISKENVIVKRFDRNYFYNGDLNQDFLHILGVKVDDSFQQLKETANTGISVQSGEIKRVLNRLKPITMAENNKLLEILNECENVLPESNTSLMSTDEVKNFMEQFVDSNESIVDEYIGDGKPLFDYTYKETTAWDYNDKNYHEELILFFANAVGSVYKENQQLKKELNKINNQIKNINEKLNKEKSYSRETRYLLKHPIKSFYNKFKGALRKK
ncbi:hypothetical protein, partial [Ruminococcus sp.]|uniref:hypothetical protein n=1 Tax=Ruminococcus sp. TaxID=41978 RepID=UPI002E7FE035